jgi:hypothetical protein
MGNGSSGEASSAGGSATTGGELGPWQLVSDVGAAGASGEAGVEPGAPLAFPTSSADWNIVVGTGQSLAVGERGSVTTTEQPYGNLTLDLGDAEVPPFDPTSPELSLVPLVEPVHQRSTTYPSAYPRNIAGETPHTAMSIQVSALVEDASGGDYVTVHSVIGENGQPMSVIDKGAAEELVGATSKGRAYAATLFEAEAIQRIASADSRSLAVGAIVITHGESDAGNARYDADLVQLWGDYNEDLRAITGQEQPIPMLISQQHSVPDSVGASSVATLLQWTIGLDHPGQLICSGPKYQYPYHSDAVHLVAEGYRLLGEKYGQVYYERVVLGNNWQPLQPIATRRSERVIEIRFHVPVPPLAWDDELPPPHQTEFSEWSKGQGFEVRADNDPVEIESVELDGDIVRIVCADNLEGRVEAAYAWTSEGEPMPDGTVRWGLLRDSDPFVGATTEEAQPNYSVAFEVEVE